MSDVIELVDSRVLTESSATYHYMARGYADEPTALAAVLAVAPSTVSGLARTGYALKPLGVLLYDCTVTYGVLSVDAGSQSVSFEITGQNQHITHSRNTTSYAPSGVTAPNHYGAIGVSKDGKEIAGTDILIPTFSMTATQSIAVASMTGSFIMSLYNLVGKTNSSGVTIGGASFAANEVLYAGCRGSQKGTENWELSHSFMMSANVTGMTVGPITGIDKQGWQYLWIYYAPTDDSASNTIVAKPLAAYVEDVYDSDDFSVLGVY